MSSFSFSRLFPSWFSLPSKHPNPALPMKLEEIERLRATELVQWLRKVLDPPLDLDDEEKIGLVATLVEHKMLRLGS